MRRSKSPTLALGLLLAACADPPAAQPEPQAFVVESSDVWSGTSLTVRSGGFVDAEPSAVLLDDDSLLFTRVDDSTIHVSLPDAPGTHQLRVVSNLVLSTPVPVKLNGFLNAEAGPVFMGRAARGANLTEVYASGPTGLRRWNVSTGALFDYPDSMHAETCSRGVGLGTHPGELLLNSGCSAWQVWRVEPTVQPLDTAVWYNDRFVDQQDNTLVVPGAHYTGILRCDTPCTGSWTRTESPFDVVYAPAGNRAVVLSYRVSDTGVAVVDVPGARVNYYVDRLQSAEGAVFSDDGDTLFLAGGDSIDYTSDAEFILALRAADGLVVDSVRVPFRVCGVALDPVRSQLYAAGHVSGTGVPVLAVFDRAHLAPVTLLSAPMYTWGFPCMVLPDPLERRIYVIESPDGGFDVRIHARIARFETPPYP
jgi:hypothetical protein